MQSLITNVSTNSPNPDSYSFIFITAFIGRIPDFSPLYFTALKSDTTLNSSLNFFIHSKVTKYNSPYRFQ